MTTDDTIPTTPTAPVIPPPIKATTVDEMFARQTFADAEKTYISLINLYVQPLNKFYAKPETAGAGQPSRSPPYTGMSLNRRVVALGTRAVPLFAANAKLKAFIESLVNEYIEHYGVPAVDSSLGYIVPRIKDGAFTLPGVPAGYDFVPAEDGSATMPESVPPTT